MSAVVVRFEDIKTKKAKIDFVKQKLEADERWILRALLAVYEHQTEAERQASETKEHNGVGFTAFDAEFMTAMAKIVKNGKTLSPRQFEMVKRNIKKYATQLVSYTQKRA